MLPGTWTQRIHAERSEDGHHTVGYAHGKTAERADANARLIAAAPDLLAACREAVGLQAREAFDAMFLGPASDATETIDAHRARVWKMLGAAIARAEGGAA